MMMAVLKACAVAVAFWLLSSFGHFAQGAITRVPDVAPADGACDSRPCTYTCTCAAATCSDAEIDAFDTLLDGTDADPPQRGDTVEFEAGKVFPIDADDQNDPISIANPAGASGYLVITSTKESECPAEGVRITPTYAGVVPWFRTEDIITPAINIMADNGGNPAEYITLRCLGFDTEVLAGAAAGAAPLQIGMASFFGTQWGTTATAAAHQPGNIVVERSLFLNGPDWRQQVNRLFSPNGRTLTVRDSYFEGAVNRAGTDTQAIGGWNGDGPYTFINNYIGWGSESVIFGGAAVSYAVDLDGVTFRHNYFPMVMERFRYEQWSASSLVFQGKYIRSTASVDQYIAQNTGTTGSGEPTWPGVVGNTVVDGEVTWEKMSGRPKDKNRFEIKWGRNFVIEDNVFDGFVGGDDGQYAPLVFKSVNTGNYSGSGSGCVPWLTGTVDTAGTAVTWVSGDSLPEVHQPSGVTADDITINSVGYEISDFQIGTPDAVTLTATAGSQSGVTFEFGYKAGSDQCFPAYEQNILVRHNIIRNSAGGAVVAAFHNGLWPNLGTLVFSDNLFDNIDCSEWSYHTGACGSTTWTVFATGFLPELVRWDHNTMLVENNGKAPFHFFGVDTDYPLKDTTFNSNISNKLVSGGTSGDGDTEGCCGASKALSHVCPSSGTCPITQWDANILAGVDTSLYAGMSGTTESLCATSAACAVDYEYDDPANGILFENHAAGLYVVRNGHTLAKRGSPTTGRDLGVDFIGLPMIRDVRITPTDDKALIEWWVHPSLRDQTCVVGVREGDPDFSEGTIGSPGYVTDQNPDTYAQPDSAARDDFVEDGWGRMYVAGLNSGLAANTIHYARVMCGGDTWPTVASPSDGEFSTLATLAGTRTIAVSYDRTGGSTTLEYGTAYSRATDTISSGGTVEQTCSGACQFSWTATRGEIYYYRIQGEGSAPGTTAVQ